MSSDPIGWSRKLQELVSKKKWERKDFERETLERPLRVRANKGGLLALSLDTISDYLKPDPILPSKKKRHRYVELVDFFVQCNAITSIDEANEWLAMAGIKELTEDEIEDIFDPEGVFQFDKDAGLSPQTLSELEEYIRRRAPSFSLEKHKLSFRIFRFRK